MNEKWHRVIGIDLGTTYSASAAYNRFTEQTEIICNPEDGRQTTPSVVSLDNTGRVIVGNAAKNNLAFAPENTIIEIKREMGEEFRPETLDKFQARGLYRAREEGVEGDPVKVRLAGEWFTPQEISAFILMKMKAIAEQEVGEEIRDAVITVPAYFKEKQRKATEEAARLAGLYPRQIIPEPTAAAICYGVDRLEPTRKIYLVYDLGGGTFDVSIITVEEQRIEVISTSGNSRLGGGDFDDAIARWAVEELRRHPHGIEAGDNHAAKARIKLLAERAKIELSTFATTQLNLAELWPEKSPILELSRDAFEQMIDADLDKSLSYVDRAINQAEAQRGVRREDIDAILLVGGSSKIPQVKAKLLDYFKKDESFVRADLDPDAVVARGAAMMALRFAPSLPPFDINRGLEDALINTEIEQDLHVQLITEHSLGIAVQGNIFDVLVAQGTNLPVSISRDNYTNGGMADYIPVRVYQGEGRYVFENTLIGVLQIGPMEPRPEGYHKFAVTFSLDVNGLLSMTIHHLNEGKTYQARFDQKTGIGGPEAMITKRKKLLQMFGAGARQTAPPGVSPPYSAPDIQPPPPPSSAYPPAAPTAAPPGYYIPPGSPVPPPSHADYASGNPSASPPQPPGAYPQWGVPTPPGTMPGTYAQPGGPVAHPSPGAGYPAPPAGYPPAYPPADMPPAGTQPIIVEPQRDVPEQFKMIVRKSRKHLLTQMDVNLLAAFNAFTIALNSGKTEEELEELGDLLDDAYRDCRN
jgi:molecular chaperone DnaK (HSP70)